MSISLEVYRGSKNGHVVADRTSRVLQHNEVYIETTHSGLCGTDLHFLNSDQVLGHEGVGVVRQCGPGVTSVKVGDRVGFGYVRKVCGVCDNCATGWDQYCRTGRNYGECDYDIGSFSHGAVWDADCVFPIPDGYLSQHAAPLLCAGSSVWSCLHNYGARATERVGIMGIGGLGHLAIKLAAAMGYHVVVLSRSEAKREDAMKFGASEFHVFDPSIKTQGFRALNRLLLCGSASLDYSAILPIMDTNSIIFPLTVELEPQLISVLPLNLKGVRIQGSTVCSRHNLRQLLKFASRNNITPTIMKFPMTKNGIEEALQKLRDGDVRYRAVLVRDLD